ncbi:MAG: hypothetical protein AB1564_06845 [Chloroflexota bacterium]
MNKTGKRPLCKLSPPSELVKAIPREIAGCAVKRECAERVREITEYNLLIREGRWLMTTFTITLPDERVKKLHELANRFRVAPEELVRASLEELLARPMEDFQQALERVLSKNADLYKRLA